MSSLRLYNQKPIDLTKFPFTNFHEILNQHKKNASPFVTFYDSGNLKSTLTFSEFYSKVQVYSDLISSYPINEDSHIAVALENSIEAMICFAAVMNLGLILIPIDPNQSAKFYEKISTQLHCDFVITTSDHISKNSFPHSLTYQETTSVIKTVVLKPKTSSVIFTSSGTTGNPKGIVQSFESLLANSTATIKVHSLDKTSKHFCILPLFHVNAFCFSFLTSLINGNELVLNKNFSQRNFWETVNATNPTILSAIPPVIRLLTEDPREFKITPTLKYFVSAASNLGKKTLVEFYRKFNIPIIQAYGLSETVNFTSTFDPTIKENDYEKIIAMDDKTSIGGEVWGNNIFVLNDKDELITTEKTEGEIAVRGWNIMTEYYKNEEATSEVFKNDYFHTGDIGYFRIINNKKFYYLNGRKKEIAKINGKLIFLNEIDELLLKIDYISNACSVCYLDINEEEQLGAYLTLNIEKDVTTIKSELKKILPAIIIKKIIIGKDIIITPSGKKRRAEMSKVYFNEKRTVYD